MGNIDLSQVSVIMYMNEFIKQKRRSFQSTLINLPVLVKCVDGHMTGTILSQNQFGISVGVE